MNDLLQITLRPLTPRLLGKALENHKRFPPQDMWSLANLASFAPQLALDQTLQTVS